VFAYGERTLNNTKQLLQIFFIQKLLLDHSFPRSSFIDQREHRVIIDADYCSSKSESMETLREVAPENWTVL
jgi:hypothetical protein